MQKKLRERLQEEVTHMDSLKGFKGNYSKLALSNLLDNNDKQQQNRSLLMYLSAHLFHKPKFPELSLYQAVSLMMCRHVPGRAYSR